VAEKFYERVGKAASISEWAELKVGAEQPPAVARARLAAYPAHSSAVTIPDPGLSQAAVYAVAAREGG